LEIILAGVRGKLAKGTVWISAAGAVTNFLSFISTIVLARFLVPADFGLVALATTILAILSSVTDLSLTSALVQHRNPTIDHFNTAWTLGFARSVILAAIFCAAAYPIGMITHEPRLPAVMLVSGIGLVLTGIANPRAIMVTRDLIFWQQFLLTVGQRIASFVVAVVIAVIYRSYWAIVWGSIIGQAVNVVISYTILPFRPGLGVKHTKELIHFSIWLTVSQIINTLNYNFDQLIIGTAIGRGALGYYTVGNNLAIMPTRETTRPITVTLFPAFSRLKDDIPRLGLAYQKAQAMVTAITLPAGFGMALIAGPLVRLFMGERWLPVVFIIQVLAAVFAVQTLGTLSQPLAMAAGATRLLFLRDLQGFLMRVPFIIGGMLIDGLTGIIYARALTGLIAVLLHMQVVKRITGLSFWNQFAANLRSLLSVGIMAGALLLLSHPVERLGLSSTDLIVEVIILVALGAVSYVSAHITLWVIMGRPEAGPEHEMLKAISAILQRFRPKITYSS
jgi:lipopolysaccharide exporter